MEGFDALGLDASEMCLIPGIVIPAKFKVPNFQKYKGASDPRTHIRAYSRKMAAYSDDDRLLTHFFQDSLSGAFLEWYMQLEGTHIHTWREMAEDFLKHYQYNTDIAPNCTQLQNQTHKFEETFKEYAQRWRELAARVQPPLLEHELVDMFMGNLQGPYLDRMVVSTSSGFSGLVLAGERIANMIKMGKIQNSTSTSGLMKKPYVAYGKK
ncbi:uncharacterized protein LOC127123211 [Lathyrus oleraceus]|uniref:uncharacterized protein LOC127123211 n=1 Tax=Pisum sativum TaxID=3888 RepID=UPI0021D3415B|nr:uncharacterized protein LOC127123211 [Pisum sativum]